MTRPMPPLVCDHIPAGTVTVNGVDVLACVPCARAYLRSLPCSVRCWHVGGPVDVAPGEPCPECGTVEPTP
jgi:hypothetical protein